MIKMGQYISRAITSKSNSEPYLGEFFDNHFAKQIKPHQFEICSDLIQRPGQKTNICHFFQRKGHARDLGCASGVVDCDSKSEI